MQIFENITYLWLIAGAVMIIFEFFLISGVGFLFAGLGALTIGFLLEIGIGVTLLAQWLIFLAAAALWTLVLWQPLRRFKFSHNLQSFSDVVGQKVILISTLEPGKTGKARWSGTIMNAKLDPNDQVARSEGAEVTVTRVEGNSLVVK